MSDEYYALRLVNMHAIVDRTSTGGGFVVSFGSILSGGTISTAEQRDSSGGSYNCSVHRQAALDRDCGTIQVTASAAGVTKTATLTTSLLTPVSVAD